MSNRRLAVAIVGIALGAMAQPLAAQLSLSVGPVTGRYHPFGHFAPTTVSSTQLASDPSQLAGTAWGASAQLRLGPRLAFEGAWSTTRSTIPATNTPGGATPATPARVTVATLLGQYDVSPRPTRLRLWLGAGPALVRHSEGGYSRYDAPASVGGAASVAASVPLSSRFELAATVNGVAYTFDVPMPPELSGNPGNLQHADRRDLLTSIALRWHP